MAANGLKLNEYKDKKIFLVGSPNVGKSAVFNSLTGSYVTVSNYPGTTVDITSGFMRVGKHHKMMLVDTPGMYSLSPITAEENVARMLILEGKPDCILHIVDAKNLERMLSLTFQLMDTGIPVILVLNMYDEFIIRGMQLNMAHLEHDLGIPVVETVATRGTGIDNLMSRIIEVVEGRYDYNEAGGTYSPDIENRISGICGALQGEYSVSKRAVAALLLQEDQGMLDIVRKKGDFDRVRDILADLAAHEIMFKLTQDRMGMIREIVQERVVSKEVYMAQDWKETLSQVMVHPVWGIPFLAAVVWFGLYKFVGVFGAGFLVDLVETNLFENIINPKVDMFFQGLFGSNALFDLFAGEYGIITLGIRYAIAIIFPIVATFFIAFSVIEDSGYLPRLAMLVDRIFKKIGLSGRAVIPMTLGFGCDTMATIVTRTLETAKEKIIATLLLSLAVPCSAQLGVLLGLLSGRPNLLAIWLVTVSTVFLLTGVLAKHLVKGEAPTFFMELPPLRMPSFINVFTKTYTRMIWYFKEVIPVFVGASVVIWAGKITGVFDALVRIMAHPVRWSGMPEAAAPAFLYGFFRRDFGAAGLFDLVKQGVLDGKGLLIAAVVLTLFVPCVAQFAVAWKERGKMMAIGMALFIFPFAFFVGFILKVLLGFSGVKL